METEEYKLSLHKTFKEGAGGTKEMLVREVRDFLSLIVLGIEGIHQDSLVIGTYYHPDNVFKQINEIMPLRRSRIKMISSRGASVFKFQYRFPNSTILTRADGNYGVFRVHDIYTDDPNRELLDYHQRLALNVIDALREGGFIKKIN